MGADADVMTDDFLVDFKVVKNEPGERDLLQLAGYAALAHVTLDIHINRMERC
jgi:hypothetical protein